MHCAAVGIDSGSLSPTRIQLLGDELILDVAGVEPITIHLGRAHPAPHPRGCPTIPLVAGIPRQGACAFRTIQHAVDDLADADLISTRESWVIKDRLRQIAREVVASCDPAALAIARRFPTGTRVRLYRWLRADPSGRLAQLATVCPGALLLAIAATELFDHPQAIEAARRIVHDTRAGIPLRQLLRRAVEDLAPLHADLSTAAIMVRRAGPKVPPHMLLRGAPVGLVPEDIPTPVLRNLRWFRAVYGIPRITDPDASPAIVALGRAISAQAEALHAHAAGRRTVNVLAASLALYVDRTDRRPPRDTPLARLFAEERRWWRTEREHLAAATLARHAALLRALPDPPLPALDTEDLQLRPLRTAEDLRDEGRRMHHCVGALAGDLLTGAAVYYAVRIGRARLTLQLLRTPAGWTLGQLRGVGNRLPTVAEHAALAPLLAPVIIARKAA